MHNKYESRRHKAQRIWQAGVDAVQPQHCIPAALEELTDAVGGWKANRPVLVIGGGKAGSAMARAVERDLLRRGVPPTQLTGWINVPAGGSSEPIQCIHLHTARPAGFNFPTPEAVVGTEQILKLVDNAADDTLILCLISGGGSAIMCAPVPEVPLQDKLLVSKLLSEAGASIGELNAVRKHLSQFKGGRLAERCFAKTKPGSARHCVSLIISDVIGDPLDVIASGPTAVDPTTFTDAIEVLRAKNLQNQAPTSVLNYLQAGAEGKHAETMKRLPRAEPFLINRVVANSAKALEAAAQYARSMGYEVKNLGDQWAGDTLQLADQFAHQLEQTQTDRPMCILSGGETTVQLPTGHGLGGRNQSMALAMLANLFKEYVSLKRITILCAGTDGEDGPTDAAGAFADWPIAENADRQSLSMMDHLAKHDAYSFFQATGGLLKTELTETNVMDLRVFLIDPQSE